MVDRFNARVKELGLPEDKIFATVKDITYSSDDMVQKFDVVVVRFVYIIAIQVTADPYMLRSAACPTASSRRSTRPPLR
jgi:hypothetical protein